MLSLKVARKSSQVTYRPLPSCPALCRASTSSLAAPKHVDAGPFPPRRTWMAGTSPAMTMLGRHGLAEGCTLACTKLDASVEASGPHDFAVRVQHRSSAVLTIASIASRPASVTIASAPWWDETARLSRCFALQGNPIIFASGTRRETACRANHRLGRYHDVFAIDANR